MNTQSNWSPNCIVMPNFELWVNVVGTMCWQIWCTFIFLLRMVWQLLTAVPTFSATVCTIWQWSVSALSCSYLTVSLFHDVADYLLHGSSYNIHGHSWTCDATQMPWSEIQFVYHTPPNASASFLLPFFPVAGKIWWQPSVQGSLCPWVETIHLLCPSPGLVMPASLAVATEHFCYVCKVCIYWYLPE